MHIHLAGTVTRTRDECSSQNASAITPEGLSLSGSSNITATWYSAHIREWILHGHTPLYLPGQWLRDDRWWPDSLDRTPLGLNGLPARTSKNKQQEGSGYDCVCAWFAPWSKTCHIWNLNGTQVITKLLQSLKRDNEDLVSFANVKQFNVIIAQDQVLANQIRIIFMKIERLTWLLTSNVFRILPSLNKCVVLARIWFHWLSSIHVIDF